MPRPSSSRPAGPPGCLAQAVQPSSLGDIRLACTERGLAGLWFVDQRDDPGEAVAPRADHPWLALAGQALQDYWARGSAANVPAALPLDLHGSPFQLKVWQALLTVPAGSTESYAALAARCGCPAATRAVAAAVGRNPVSIFVPCHRIVGGNGSLTGFGGGLWRKQALLQHEGLLPPGPIDPAAAPAQLARLRLPGRPAAPAAARQQVGMQAELAWDAASPPA